MNILVTFFVMVCSNICYHQLHILAGKNSHNLHDIQYKSKGLFTRCDCDCNLFITTNGTSHHCCNHTMWTLTYAVGPRKLAVAMAPLEPVQVHNMRSVLFCILDAQCQIPKQYWGDFFSIEQGDERDTLINGNELSNDKFRGTCRDIKIDNATRDAAGNYDSKLLLFSQ